MNSAQQNLLGVIEIALFDQPRKTAEELRQLASGLSAALQIALTPVELEQVVRLVEEKDGIRAGLGAIIDDGEFVPWLDDAKASIDPYYWTRYRKLLIQQGMPRDVVVSLDKVTDSILSRMGNPKLDQAWDRRGMVVGHVQSGKTANYAGLICKAADAGYRLIVVIAGIHNNLRNQTQGRVDEGFIGRDTGRLLPSSKSNKNVIGVGKFDSSRTPVSLTNTIRDFHKATASTNTSEIDSYNVPVVLVIKKNHRTLANLLEWLRDNSARGDSEMIDQPMLLIDDEADNASINTKYKDELVTKINGQIRDLLKMFHRSCYVGYTATPFANIFIDPDQDSEMFKEDLFPRDFIVGLDAPTNYFGGTKIFVDGFSEDGKPVWLRTIPDNDGTLPIKHPIDQKVELLPPSLHHALRAFLVARTIRDLRGQSEKHCSMLVNASRFTGVQGLIRNRLHEAVERIQNSVRVNASLGERALDDTEIACLREVWQAEYREAWHDWSSIQNALLEAIASAKVVEVNSRANDLNYTAGGARGQTVIAVGGFSLSRGLTLEGLTVTWFLRNSMMYDTLMQMGRWFGYRDGYEDLCRIWMPDKAIKWYSFIANATDELHRELKIMESAKATPNMFGLAVRSHPSALMVTARNKMGSSEEITTMVGLANKFVETSRITLKDIEANKRLARQFFQDLSEDGFTQSKAETFQGGHLLTSVKVGHIDRFLAGWRNADVSVTTSPAPIRSYIKNLNDELSLWDVLVTGLQSGEKDGSLGWGIRPISRYVDLTDLDNGIISFSGKRMRVASRGIEKAGVDVTAAACREDQFRKKEGFADDARVNYPDSIYREIRTRPLFILHLVNPTAPKGEEEDDRAKILTDLTAVAWGISLPKSDRGGEEVAYVVNTRKMIELFGSDEPDEGAGDDVE
ncbi:Z1 domain-containing protein [Agrobacterium tumefaciens]|uniref:Z1 domain-containing protein n=1 Tax=Agrobacterium tumefaciens TaxID=358 RepID=UPI00045A48DA|nr:Z1 domain-containing protein [Agrobacterium tumefaciens]CDN95978.1 Z1 domain-containing protein [Agrobacterium tumefaciens]